MSKKTIKDICPTCGQPLKLLKSNKKHIHTTETLDQTDPPSKPFEMLSMYQCLNCDEKWEKELTNNVFKKKHHRLR